MINFNLTRNSYHYGESGSWPFSEDFKGSMERYLVQGLKPGGFGEAMLARDLERALCIADTHNRKMFWAIAMWVRDELPQDAWGSYEAVEAWCADTNGVRTKWAAWQVLKAKELA